MAAATTDDEKKLGPGVTYTPEDENSKTPVEAFGVTFVPGQSVNVEDRLGKEGSKKVLEKLASNPSFKVDGGTDWKQEADKKAKAEEEDAKAAAKAREDAEKEAAKAAGKTPGPPDDWQGPDSAGLESDSAARRPTIRNK